MNKHASVASDKIDLVTLSLVEAVEVMPDWALRMVLRLGRGFAWQCLHHDQRQAQSWTSRTLGIVRNTNRKRTQIAAIDRRREIHTKDP